MDPDLKNAIAAEVTGDPAGRGYAGKAENEIAVLMNGPFVVASAVSHRDVPISDVEGFMEARMIPVRLEDWLATAEPGVAKDAARTLLRVIASQNLKAFTTSTVSGRANILGLFAAIAKAAPDIVTPTHYADLAAMIEVQGGSVEHHPRWMDVMVALSAVGSAAAEGLPNEITAEMVAEALA